MKAYITVLDGDDALVPYYVRHYTRLGATHYPLITYGGKRNELDRIAAVIRQAGGEPEPLNHFSSASFSARHRDRYIRQVHGDQGWAFFTDLDEFCQLTAAEVRRLIKVNPKLVAGRWLDRVAAQGKLRDLTPGVPLETIYPYGCDTREQLHAGNLVYVLSPHGPTLHHPNVCKYGKRYWRRCPRVCVHHFKWQTNVTRRLSLRLQRIVAKRSSQGKQPHNGWYHRVRRTLEYLQKHDGVDASKMHYIGSILDI